MYIMPTKKGCAINRKYTRCAEANKKKENMILLTKLPQTIYKLW